MPQVEEPIAQKEPSPSPVSQVAETAAQEEPAQVTPVSQPGVIGATLAAEPSDDDDNDNDDDDDDSASDDGRGVSVTPPQRPSRAESDEEYVAEEDEPESSKCGGAEPEHGSDQEDSSPAGSDEEEPEEDLETKFFYLFQNSLRTEQGQMNFPQKLVYKKWPKGDPSKSKSKIASKSPSTFILMRSTCPYFEGQRFVEPSCSDPRFQNEDKRGVYHEIVSQKRIVDSKMID